MKIRRAVGIDLGTTNSAVAVMDPQGRELWLLEDRFKRKTIPSMVGWDPMAEGFVTGWEAWNRRALEPAPIASIKRKMGTQRAVALGPHEMKPEEVSGRILSRLRAEIRHFLRERSEADGSPRHVVDQAVITVPAYFDAPQIEATRRAGELADIEVVGLLQEPTAAAMYYTWKHGIGDGTFLVYDLGGGTFDVSVIRCLLGEYQVLGIDGDNYLGGDDFDRKLAEFFRKHLVERGYDLDLDIANDPDDAVRFMLLTRLAQEVKESLSAGEVQFVGRTNLFEDRSGNPVSLNLEVSREEFEGLIGDLVDETVKCCERALAKSMESAGVGLSEIDHILLVGGSTRVPLVQERVRGAFIGAGKSRAERVLIDEPDTCVALGAAVHAANVAGLGLIDDTTFAEPSVATVTSALATKSSTARVVGRMASPRGAEVESVVLLDGGGGIAGLARPEVDGEELVFAIEDLELKHDGVHPFSLEFCDRDGEPLAAFEVELVKLSRAELLRSTGSALSNPSVLAKDIYLEVVRDGRPDRELLLGSGESLPAQGTYRFYTADHAGAVILRLFQNRFPIKTVHLSVPEETELGTPVELKLSVDEAMSMVASGEILGQTFWAQIEPPPAREIKDWQQIEELLNRVDVVARELWGNEARYFRERTNPLVAGIRETARTDPDKLQVLVARLEEVVEDYHQRDTELTPGYGRYVALMDAIKRVAYRDDGQLKLGMGTDEWRGRISQLERAADAAFEAKDQRAWGKAFNQVQALWESLAQDEYRFSRADSEGYVRRLYLSLAAEVSEIGELLAGFNYSGNPETRALQEREVTRLEAELSERVSGPLEAIEIDSGAHAQLKHELDLLAEAAEHIRRRYDKLPTIGLVRH
jgi:molecular chaperone DnaK